jgi:hypothetical protein
VTHSIVQAPLQSESLLYLSRLVKTRRLHSGLLQLLSGFFNHHPVSLISFPSHLNLSPPSSYPSSISSHLSSVIYLLPFYIGGSAATPSHLRRGPSVDIPSVRRSQLSHQPLHPHFIVQVGQRLVKRNIKTRIPSWRCNKQPESFGHSKAHSNRILFTVYHSKTYQKSTSKEPFGTRSWYHQDTLHNQVHQKNQEPVLGFLSILTKNSESQEKIWDWTLLKETSRPTFKLPH